MHYIKHRDILEKISAYHFPETNKVTLSISKQ